jgi:NADPH-dependent 2,4-dienoyl-CoA reductase/sulfur reductase-like enzyme
MRHVIIGNGPAGVVAAEALRAADPASSIVLIGDEPHPPYSRMALPYLMMGRIEEPGTYLRKTPGHFDRLRIELRTDRVEQVDPRAGTLRLRQAGPIPYDRLLIATGSRPITPPIPGVDLPGVHTCWTMEDARKIMERAASGARVLQIGAGFIGCIILEALAARGVRLTVVEMGDRMVPRMMTPVAGDMIRKWCESKGVRVHVGSRVVAIRAAKGKAGPLLATLDSKDEIGADLVIVAAGVRPNMEFLEGSGIACEAGILVDESMQTSVSGVYASGDVSQAPDLSTGTKTVNAIQPNAVEQGRIAALNMAGKPAQSHGGLALNVLDTLGLISSSFGKWWGEPSGESVELVDHDHFRYLSLQFQEDKLIGATSIGLTEDIGVLRGLIEGRVRLGPWKAHLLRDPIRIKEAYLARAQAAA